MTTTTTFEIETNERIHKKIRCRFTHENASCIVERLNESRFNYANEERIVYLRSSLVNINRRVNDMEKQTRETIIARE